MVFSSLRQGYVAAREADLPVGFVRERDGIDPDCSLYLLPCVKQIQGPTWQELRRLVRDGAVLYLSYCAGEVEHHRSAWLPYLDEAFGVEKQLAYGLVDPVEDDVVELTFAADFGSITAGEVLRFRAGGNEHSRAFLPVRPWGAEVVATDRHGWPALLRHSAGRGETVLSTYPLEHFAATNPRVNPEDTYRIYAALAEGAGVPRPITVDTPGVFADTLVHADGRRFAWLVSQTDDTITVTPEVHTGSLRDLNTREEVHEIALPPYGVRVLELAPG